MHDEHEIKTTIVTAGDQAFAWGTLLLVASLRKNNMSHPVVVGAMNWPEVMKERLLSLGGVTIKELSTEDSRCLTCQKPMLMASDEVKTDWVCWADSDAVFVGDCSDLLVGATPEEIVIRKYHLVPPDFTPDNLEIWRQDVNRFCGSSLDASRYPTRVNASFIVVHRKWKSFLNRWQMQIEKVLPPDVEIIMEHGSAYFQTDESVLASLLCFFPDAPIVSKECRANDNVDKTRYFAHMAYNPKPWQMWNSNSLKWHDVVMPVVAWLLERRVISPGDLPLSLRPNWWPFFRSIAFAAPWIWRAIKFKRRIIRCFSK